MSQEYIQVNQPSFLTVKVNATSNDLFVQNITVSNSITVGNLVIIDPFKVDGGQF